MSALRPATDFTHGRKGHWKRRRSNELTERTLYKEVRVLYCSDGSPVCAWKALSLGAQVRVFARAFVRI